jgi:hypothetical protein
MRRIKRAIKSFMVALMKSRRDLAVAKMKSGLYHWE